MGRRELAQVQEQEELRWWCVQCNTSVRVMLPAVRVWCKKGHKMKQLSEMEQRAQGVL